MSGSGRSGVPKKPTTSAPRRGKAAATAAPARGARASKSRSAGTKEAAPKAAHAGGQPGHGGPAGHAGHPGSTGAGAAGSAGPNPGRRVIRRYGNRRLYDAWLSRGVTMEEVAEFVRKGEDVHVVDEHDNDITRRLLLQIILDDPARNALDLLPVTLLRTMITTHRSESTTRWLEQYLGAGADWLERQSSTFSGAFPGPDLSQAIRSFVPWMDPHGGVVQPHHAASRGAPAPAEHRPAPARAENEGETELRDEVDELQRRLAEIAARMKRR